jgi:hypothetical protein
VDPEGVSQETEIHGELELARPAAAAAYGALEPAVRIEYPHLEFLIVQHIGRLTLHRLRLCRRNR